MEALERLLSQDDPQTRINAATVLTRIGDGDAVKITAILAASSGRVNLLLLGAWGVKASAQVPKVIQLLEEQQWGKLNSCEADAAIMALGDIGQGNRQALQMFMTLLESIPRDSYSLSHLFKAMKKNARELLGELRFSLEGGQPIELRYKTAKALGRFGPIAQDAIPELTLVLRDENGTLRYYAAEALSNIVSGVNLENFPTLLPLLIEALQDKAKFVAPCAIDALGRIGSQAAEAIAPILALFESQPHGGSGKVRQAIALAKIAPKDERVISRILSELIFALNGGHTILRVQEASEALGQIGPLAKQALPRLRAMQEHEYERVRDAASFAIRQIEPRGEPEESKGL